MIYVRQPGCGLTSQIMTLNQSPLARRSLEFPLRLLQFALAASVLAFAAYTLSRYHGWSEIRFTVAAVLTSYSGRV